MIVKSFSRGTGFRSCHAPRTTGSESYPTRHGMMLLDLLVSIMLIGLLCGIFALIMNHTMKAQSLQAESFDRLQQGKALADQFRTDVARATDAPQQRGRHIAEHNTLILQMNSDEHVVYLWNDGALKRLAHTKDDAAERALPVPFGMNVEFVRPADDAKLIRLRLTPVRQGKEVAGQSLEFAANLGGDRR